MSLNLDRSALVNLHGVQQYFRHFVFFFNFSALLTDLIKSKDIFEMPFKFSVGKCQKNVSDLQLFTNMTNSSKTDWN